MPVQIKGQNIGYILISMVLDDYKALSQKKPFEKIRAPLCFRHPASYSAFSLQKNTRSPSTGLPMQARKIAEVSLSRSGSSRKDEIGVYVIRSYNDMVEKLAERMELEEKLKKSENLPHRAAFFWYSTRNQRTS